MRFSNTSQSLVSSIGILSCAATVMAQANPQAQPAEESSFMWYALLLIFGAAAVGGLLWYSKKMKAEDEGKSKKKKRIDDEIDFDFVKNPLGGKNSRSRTSAKNDPVLVAEKPGLEFDLDNEILKKKIRNMQFLKLPVNSFTGLRPPFEVEALEFSKDPDLIAAVEQAQDEFEEDKAVRALAIRILAAFRTQNSVEALAQIALYDVSSELRSKAVLTLTAFNHPSVFETVLLACADPTRGVRAAAARGLFHLDFDRGDAWARIAESCDEFRMKQAARAAIEADIVTRSFERLMHEELNMAYEAFALVMLLIRAGETEPIFKAIKGHSDNRIRIALVKIIGVSRDSLAIGKLAEIVQTKSFPNELSKEIQNVVNGKVPVAA